MDPLLLAGVALLPTAAGVALWTVKNSKPTVTAEELLGPMNSGLEPIDLRKAVLSQSALERAVKPFLEKIFSLIRRLTPMGWSDTIQQRLMLADSRTKPEFVILQKFIYCAAFFVLFELVWDLTWKSGIIALAIDIGKPALGFFLPDIMLKNKAQKRQDLIQKTLPDVLDQITVGVEAGLGFDAAMSRAAKSNEGPLAMELMRTLQHVQAGLSRAEAMRGLANRNKVPELRQFVGAILQAEQYGVPMAQVLRVQAAEQRRRRRQRAEEKAMKLPVKVLFPLVLCILPTLFIVLIGPAVISIANGVSG
jgi:tight adherence protein C